MLDYVTNSFTCTYSLRENDDVTFDGTIIRLLETDAKSTLSDNLK